MIKPLDINKLLPLLTRYLRTSNPLQPKPLISQGNSGLPESLKEQFIQGLKELASIPFYELEKIIKQINMLRMLCEGYDTPCVKILSDIKRAAYNSSQQQYQQQIEECSKLVDSTIFSSGEISKSENIGSR